MAEPSNKPIGFKLRLLAASCGILTIAFGTYLLVFDNGTTAIEKIALIALGAFEIGVAVFKRTK
jgi:hypothetical protein